MLRASQGHRLRAWRMGDGAQYLPARAGEAEIGNEGGRRPRAGVREPNTASTRSVQGLAAGSMSFGCH